MRRSDRVHFEGNQMEASRTRHFVAMQILSQGLSLSQTPFESRFRYEVLHNLVAVCACV